MEVLDHAGKKVVYQQEKDWDPQAKGMLYQDRFLEGKTDWTVGKKYTMHGFMQTLNAVVPATFTVLGRKKMTIDGVEKELVELEQSYPKELYIDKSKHYVDPATGDGLATTEDSSLFDLVTQTKCTKATALEAFAGTVKDRDAPVTINKPIPLGLLGLPNKLRIEIEMSEDDNPEAVFMSTPPVSSSSRRMANEVNCVSATSPSRRSLRSLHRGRNTSRATSTFAATMPP
jgi:hypothetical protein